MPRDDKQEQVDYSNINATNDEPSSAVGNPDDFIHMAEAACILNSESLVSGTMTLAGKGISLGSHKEAYMTKDSRQTRPPLLEAQSIGIILSTAAQSQVHAFYGRYRRSLLLSSWGTIIMRPDHM